MKCLFENYNEMPKELAEVVNKFSPLYESGDADYNTTSEFYDACINIGYTFNWYLDNEPFGLRPLGVKLTDLEGFDDTLPEIL